MEQEIKNIQIRNQRVELDKAWETSLMRRFIIASVTYTVATIWLITIENNKPFLNALVPTGGYLLSTWSLTFAKAWWIRKRKHEL